MTKWNSFAEVFAPLAVMRRAQRTSLGLALALGLAAFPAAASAADKFGVVNGLAFETSSFMKETFHAVDRRPPADWQRQSGALRLNAKWEKDKTLRWFIEDQQLGGDFITAGVALGNREQVRWGFKILEWGFAQMTPEGEFKHPDNYHSVSFFVDAAAHALLVLEASPLRTEFAAQAGALKLKLQAAARWMLRPEVHALVWEDPKNSRSELHYGHRRYLDAAAIGEAGRLCQDQELLTRSAWYVRNGIAFQRTDGVNPEKGGADTHYQALGLVFACRYYALVADDALRAEMKPMLDKAFAWLLARVRSDGTVDATGNSRTGFGQEQARNGLPKGLEYRFAALALGHWGYLNADAQLQATARRVFAADQKLRRTTPAQAWDGY